MQVGPLVAFSVTKTPEGMPSSVLLLIVPTESAWNDFNFRLNSTVGVRASSDQSFEWSPGLVAFQGMNDSRRFLEKALRERRTHFFVSEEFFIPFATLFQNLRGYELLLRRLGPSTAISTSLLAHDIALLRDRKQAVPGWSDFFQTEQFTLAFMRSSDAVFAYQNGGSILAGRTLGAIDSRQDFGATVRFGRSDAHFHFRFNDGPISDNRIAVLIGRNGTGKTASLIAIGKSLLGDKHRSARLTNAPSFNQILTFAHSSNAQRFRLKRGLPRAADQLVFSLDPKSRGKLAGTLSSMFARIARDSNQPDDQLENLVQIIQQEFNGLMPVIPVRQSDDRAAISIRGRQYLPIQAFRQGREQALLERLGRIDERRATLFLTADRRPRPLSLGQEVFVRFIFRAIAEAGPASAFFIDELENFLHPNLISKFVRILHAVLSRTNSIAIISTHSPYVVREVGRTQVHVLQWDKEAGLTVEQPRMQTFGASISQISNDIFDDDLPEHLYIELIRRYPHEQMKADQFIERLKDELSLDALMRLREINEQEKQSK